MTLCVRVQASGIGLQEILIPLFPPLIKGDERGICCWLLAVGCRLLPLHSGTQTLLVTQTLAFLTPSLADNDARRKQKD
jgi:hypothetical protein